MAKIGADTLYKFKTGDIVDADVAPQGGALNPIFEIIRVALNDTDTRVDDTYTKAVIDQKIADSQAGVVVTNSITNDKLAPDVKVGSLAALTTTAKTSVTAALNEVAAKASGAVQSSGDDMFGDLTIYKLNPNLFLQAGSSIAAEAIAAVNFQDQNGLTHWKIQSQVSSSAGPTSIKLVNNAGAEVVTIGQGGDVTLTGGSGALKLKAGAVQDHVFMEFWADSQAQNTRSAWFGYGGAGLTNLSLTNDMVNGNIDINTNGTGEVRANGKPIGRLVNLPSGTNLDTIVTVGKYDVSEAVNKPTGSTTWVYLEVMEHTNGTHYATQRVTELNTGLASPPRVWVRARQNSIWSPWAPLFKTYIAPSDTVIIQDLTEIQRTSGALVTFKIKHAGKYRIKWDMRTGSGGTAAIDFRLGIANAGNLTPDITGNTSSTTTTFLPFSVEIPLPENCTVVMYGTNSDTKWLRNFQLCGSEVYENPNTYSLTIL